MTRRAFSEKPTAQLLLDGRRLHLQHGPIDLVLEACGDTGEGAPCHLAPFQG